VQLTYLSTIEQTEKAVEVQRFWRMYARRSRFLNLRTASVKVQAMGRMYNLHTTYLSDLTIMRLEAALRRTASRTRAEWRAANLVSDHKKSHLESEERERESACAIRKPSVFRGHQERIAFERTKISALHRHRPIVWIQCWYRGCNAATPITNSCSSAGTRIVRAANRSCVRPSKHTWTS